LTLFNIQGKPTHQRSTVLESSSTTTHGVCHDTVGGGTALKA